MNQAGYELAMQNKNGKPGNIHDIGNSDNIHEAIRDIVHDTIKPKNHVHKPNTSKKPEESASSTADIVQAKRDELYQILGNLDEHVKGKSPKEITAFFSSLLDIQSQLSLQKTDGVITVKIRMSDYFDAPKGEMTSSILSHEINMIYTPEEIQAIRANLKDMDEENPMRDFFANVLDQAYDSAQYDEVTGLTMLEMTDYFLQQLEKNGYGDTKEFRAFKERHKKAKVSLKNALDELRSVEGQLNEHIQSYPVLKQLPVYLRVLIQIKMGMVDKKFAPVFIQKVNDAIRDYSRVRGVVAFDFKRLPSHQYAVKRRQDIILNLQKDVLQFTGQKLEGEFADFEADFKRMVEEIETNSQSLSPGSKEYRDLMARKTQLQEEFDVRTKQLDVVKSQEKMMDVQHQMIKRSMDRFEKEGSMHKRIENVLKERKKPEIKVDDAPQKEEKAKINRMVTVDRRK